MDKFQDEAAFSCNLRIISARNVELNSMGSLFVRCYMSAGNKKSVRFESREVSSSNMVWNQSFSLDCFGAKESMKSMPLEGTVVFELRWRSGITFFGRTGKSQLLGKAQVPWKIVFESSTMDIEKWVVMETRKSLPDGVKPPAVQIGMKVDGAPLTATKAVVKQSKSSCGDKCQCRSCLNCQLFALDGALEFSC